MSRKEDKPQTGGKIFAEDTSYKRLLPKIQKVLLKLNNKKTKNSIKKMSQRLLQTSHQRRQTDGK